MDSSKNLVDLSDIVNTEIKNEGSWPQSIYMLIQEKLTKSSKKNVNNFIVFVLNQIDISETVPRERLKLAQLLKLLSLSQIKDINDIYESNREQFFAIINHHKKEKFSQPIAQYLQDCFHEEKNLANTEQEQSFFSLGTFLK